VSPPRCPHCGAVAADPVGEMIAAIKAGKVALLSPEQIAAAFHAAEAPEQVERLRVALEEHEARKDP
jgi:hypothetical protein